MPSLLYCQGNIAWIKTFQDEENLDFSTKSREREKTINRKYISSVDLGNTDTYKWALPCTLAIRRERRWKHTLVLTTAVWLHCCCSAFARSQSKRTHRRRRLACLTLFCSLNLLVIQSSQRSFSTIYHLPSSSCTQHTQAKGSMGTQMMSSPRTMIYWQAFLKGDLSIQSGHFNSTLGFPSSDFI